MLLTRSLTPQAVTLGARVSVVMTLPALAVVTLLPAFSGAEQRFGLGDHEAHCLASFAYTLLCFLAWPKVRRTDILKVVLACGALVEVAQMFSGRDASVMDFAADAVGVLLAWAPGPIEQLRTFARSQPFTPLSQLGHADRRRQRRTAAAAPAPAGAFAVAEAVEPTAEVPDLPRVAA